MRKRILSADGAKVKLTVNFGSGVYSITLNIGGESSTYYSTTTIDVKKNSKITWTATPSTGYNLTQSSGTIEKITDDTAINLSATIIQYSLSIIINSNVSKITVNGTAYTKSTTLYFNYGTSITWSAVAVDGYKLSSSSGSFSMTSNRTISPTTSMITYTLTIIVNANVDSITVNGTKYYASTTISIDYGTEVTWSAKASGGYSLDVSSGSFYMYSAQTISPVATSQPVSIQFQLHRNAASVTVNNITYTESTTIEVPYGTTVTWSSVAKSGYVVAQLIPNAITYAPSGSLKATSNFTIYIDAFYIYTWDNSEYVDLGLSVKWGTYNIGASKPDDIGLYFAWADTVGHSKDSGYNFIASNYKWGSSADKLTKYNNSKNFIELEDDAAYVTKGGKWRMPTESEIQELLRKTSRDQAICNNQMGTVFRNNNKCIFLPWNGYYTGKTLNQLDLAGWIWSSYGGSTMLVASMHFVDYTGYSSDLNTNNQYRYYGLCVRGVTE